MKDQLIRWTINLFVIVGCGIMAYSILTVLGAVVSGGK